MYDYPCNKHYVSIILYNIILIFNLSYKIDVKINENENEKIIKSTILNFNNKI